MNYIQIFTSISYWILIVLWSIILVVYIKYLTYSGKKVAIIVPLLAILSIDALRTLFESLFFGLYFTSKFGFISETIYNRLSDPGLIMIPKLVNIVTAALVLLIIFKRWLPREIAEIEKRNQQEKLLIQQSKMAAMGEMIGVVAHQWRQPLNAINIIIQDMKDAHEYGDLDDKYISETVKDTMDQVAFMSQTIDDFRDFFKPSKEKIPFNLNSAVKDVLILIYTQLKKLDIAVEMKCTYEGAIKQQPTGDNGEICICKPELIAIGYPNELKQVILNIVTNAKDAIIRTRKQGVIEVEEMGLIVIEIANDNDTAIIRIRDNGGGISKEIINKIFNPYFTTKGNEGTGIGLYVSRVIIENNMGGRLGVENAEKGAMFTIKLPTTEES